MVIDSSAVLAILQNDPERRAFNQAIAVAEQGAMSAATLVELSIVMEARFRPDGQDMALIAGHHVHAVLPGPHPPPR